MRRSGTLCGAAGALGTEDLVDHWEPVSTEERASAINIGAAVLHVIEYDRELNTNCQSHQPVTRLLTHARKICCEFALEFC